MQRVMNRAVTIVTVQLGKGKIAGKKGFYNSLIRTMRSALKQGSMI